MRVDSRKPTPVGDNIWKNVSGTFSAEYVCPITGAVKRPVMKGATSKRAAMSMRNDILADLRSRRIAAGPKESMSNLTDRWLASRKQAYDNGSIVKKTYEHDAQRYAPTITAFFGTMAVHEVSTEDVRRFLTGLEKGTASLSKRPQAQKTRAKQLTALSAVFRFKQGEAGLVFNPCDGLARHERPKQSRSRDPLLLSPAEIDAYIGHARDHSPAYVGLLTLVAFTGMRIREALALRWQDIDSEKGLIWVTEQLDEDNETRIAVKTRSSVRPVKITPRLDAVIGRKARMAARWSADEDFVFSASKARAKSYRNVRRALKRIAELAELPVAVNAHDFRHSLVMNMRPYLTDDAKRLMFAQSLGHKDTTMIDRTYGLNERQSEKRADEVGDLLAAAGIGQ